MRITQAARYARWAAGIAILLTVVVAGVYVRRAMRQSRAQREAPPAVAAAVEKQSAGFSFSQVEQDRTLFTIQASRATEFKDQDKSQLEEVAITIFGRRGDRHDTIHTHQCDYQPLSGSIVCAGAVEMDLESARDFSASPGQRVMHVAMRNVAFDRNSGKATTAEAVDFRFPYGEGHSMGITYSSNDAVVQLEKSVEMKINQPNHPNAAPLLLRSSQMEYARSENILHLAGPVHAQQGNAELLAQSAAVTLDENLHARQAMASGSPQIHIRESGGTATLTASQFTATLNGQGWVERVLAEGGVTGTREGPAGADNFQAQRGEIEMEPPGAAHNQPRVLTATGDVQVDTREGDQSRRIETAALRLHFAAASSGRQRHIETAETLAPGVISLHAPGEDTTLRGGSFSSQFDDTGRMQRLFGHSGAQMQRKTGNGAPQAVSAQEMTVSYAPGGDWTEIENTGKVKFHQGDRSAEAGHARIQRATDTILLDGGLPMISDAGSRTTAPAFEINQRTEELRATGGVSTTYQNAGQKDALDLGAGPAHVTAQSLQGNSTNGHALYTGRARLWQGDSVVQSDQIEFLRTEQRVEATGQVVALLPQPPDAKKGAAQPAIWHVTAQHLTFFNQEGRAHLEDGVHAESETGKISARVMDLFLETGTGGRRQLSRAVGTGAVQVEQEGRTATAERGEYTANEQKFFMSGGQPAITDAENGTTKGRSLTFFVASDTILVDSQAGKRTITEHRVQK
jgi:lipopolysaccharide export system protein LptA